MKTQIKFPNSSLVSVVNGSIAVKDSTERVHTFTNASIVSVNNGIIIIETEWKPKRGELVKITGQCIDAYSILDKIEGDIIYVFGWKKLNCDRHKLKSDLWLKGSQTKISPVTPEEQKEFDDFCKSQGKIWNKETLQWEKYKWEPRFGDIYYYVDMGIKGSIGTYTYENDSTDQYNYECGNCFQTKKQAQKAAEKVKELFKSL